MVLNFLILHGQSDWSLCPCNIVKFKTNTLEFEFNFIIPKLIIFRKLKTSQQPLPTSKNSIPTNLFLPPKTKKKLHQKPNSIKLSQIIRDLPETLETLCIFEWTDRQDKEREDELGV